MMGERCVICRQLLAEGASPASKAAGWFEGNNPYPLAENGRACDKCNDEEVIPARLLGVRVWR